MTDFDRYYAWKENGEYGLRQLPSSATRHITVVRSGNCHLGASQQIWNFSFFDGFEADLCVDERVKNEDENEDEDEDEDDYGDEDDLALSWVTLQIPKHVFAFLVNYPRNACMMVNLTEDSEELEEMQVMPMCIGNVYSFESDSSYPYGGVCWGDSDLRSYEPTDVYRAFFGSVFNSDMVPDDFGILEWVEMWSPERQQDVVGSLPNPLIKEGYTVLQDSKDFDAKVVALLSWNECPYVFEVEVEGVKRFFAYAEEDKPYLLEVCIEEDWATVLSKTPLEEEESKE